MYLIRGEEKGGGGGGTIVLSKRRVPCGIETQYSGLRRKGD